MNRSPLPAVGAVLVLTDAPEEWAAAVADRNAAGQRTALLTVADPSVDPSELAREMAEEVFRGADWHLFDARAGMSGAT